MKRLFLLVLLTLACAGQGSGPTPVVGDSPSPGPSAEISPSVLLDKSVYAPGESMKVTAIAADLRDTAWVWIVPAEQPPEEASKPSETLDNYAALNPGQAEVQATAPVAAGKYAVCLYREAFRGPELARGFFEVRLPGTTPSSSPTPVVKLEADPFEQ